MTFHAIIAAHGFVAPYSADPGQPGTVRDARGRPVPFLIVPGVLDCADRREFSRILAAQLNDEAEQAGEREAA